MHPRQLAGGPDPLGPGAGQSPGICTHPDGVRECAPLRVPKPLLPREGGQPQVWSQLQVVQGLGCWRVQTGSRDAGG